MAPKMTGWAADEDALSDFLAEANLCRVGTVDRFGDAHVVPAWFWWDGARFYVGAQARDVKVANIRRSGRAAIEVDSDVRRKRGVLARGAARVIDGDEGRREYLRISIEQIRRYQPDRPPSEMAARMAAKGDPVVLEVTPDRIISWGR
jgi:nitroimidazol reductase NimA-like FMN-containing flavoprotein (pyridoxamine 5'-phosphate oxidase superfamily)